VKPIIKVQDACPECSAEKKGRTEEGQKNLYNLEGKYQPIPQAVVINRIFQIVVNFMPAASEYPQNNLAGQHDKIKAEK
jgi:hypothetical protein